MADAEPVKKYQRPQYNPWLVALAVVIPTFMEVLDTTIANVALRYIAGGLSAAEVDAEWVITSYLAANAVILTVSGWLAQRLGRRNYFLLSIAVFTLASFLCGMANSLFEIILFRILQGLAGGGLQPTSQAVLLDRFPPEKQGTAMTAFGIAALVGPIVGPTLGGYLVDNYNWRWIFLVNIPVGCFAFAMSYFFLEDPDYLKKEREKLKKQPLNFDFIGLGLLTLTMASWEVVLSKGQQWDWFGDPFWRVQILAILFVVGLAGFVVRELLTSHPIVDLRVLKDRNLLMSCIVLFCTFGVLYGATISLPALLQNLFGYNAYLSGLVLSPGGFSSILMMVVTGFLMSRQVDARWLIAAGLAIVAGSNYWMCQLNLLVSPWSFVWPRMAMTAGLGLIFAPINVAAFKYVPPYLRGSAVGLVSLLRNEGGSVGTSVSQTVQERRLQFHLVRLGDNLDELNAHVNSYLATTQAFLEQQLGDPVGAKVTALQILENLREQQSASLSYFDIFYASAILGLMLTPLVFLMKRSVAEKGQQVHAE